MLTEQTRKPNSMNSCINTNSKHQVKPLYSEVLSNINKHENESSNERQIIKTQPGLSTDNQISISPDISARLSSSSSQAPYLNPGEADQWSIVTHKPKYRIRPKVGKNESTALKAISVFTKPAEVFVSRLSPDTTEKEVENFAWSQFEKASEIKCEQLTTKFPTYSSFVVTITGVSFKESLNLNNWPSGSLVKRFYAPAIPSTGNDINQIAGDHTVSNLEGSDTNTSSTILISNSDASANPSKSTHG